MQRLRHPLWLVVGAFVVLCAIYMWSIPPLEGADEFEHFAYVTWLIEEQRFPLQGEAGWNSPVRQESGQPPLYYLLASLPARLSPGGPPVVFRGNPYFRFDLDPARPDNKNTALHYPGDAGGGWRALYLARLVSVASGVLLIVCIYGLVGAALPGRPGAPLAAAAFVALMPQVIFHSSHVSNDILATAFSTLALWLLARLVRLGGSLPRGLGLGAALGLAALVKVNTLVVGLPVALGLGWLAWRGGAGGRRPGAALAAGVGAALGFVAVAGWWFARSWLLTGALLGLDTHCYQELSTCGPFQLLWPNPFAWRDTFRSFWAAFGLANVRPPDGVYWLFAGLMLLAAGGLVRLVARRLRPAGAETAPRDPHLPIVLLLMGSVVAGNILLLYVWMQQILATYGRLLFPALGGFVVLLIAGLWELRPRLARLAWLLPGALAVVAPFWLIRPAYAPPRLLDETALAARGESLGWHFGDVAELVSVRPAARSAAAGETLPVEICWRALAATDTNYTIFLQAVGPNETVVADRYTYPGLGSYPTAVWRPGDAFCDQIALPIPTDLARTLVYRLSVGLLDDAVDRRLPATDRDGRPVPPFVGQVRLTAAEQAATDAPPPGDAAIRLAEAAFPPVWRLDSAQPVTLRWYTAAAVPTDFTVFLHLRDDAGQLIGQADGPPLGGWYPTSWWATGEWVTDEHTFLLPAGAPLGNFRLVAGLYDPATGARLGSEHDLGPVEVRP